ncbi:unnamed protein product [Cuscuta campestris]|uniref:U2A'/phosphoprotein 32 family A C-terminal domain-containing protein n=1 Tax=Cuscuta campestris TaxID=132261 RepID=A0A484KD03_9ASTE|nr:unnamed protein product [Cuscuta campestris]
MVRFSCFHAHIHSHKQKKTVHIPAVVMNKSMEDHSQNHSLKDFSYCEATSPPHSISVSNAMDIYAGHDIDSPSKEQGCKSEEIEDDYKSEHIAGVDHNKNADMKKCRSLNSGLAWEGRVYDDHDSEEYSHQTFSFENFQEVLQPSSVQVSTDSENTESLSVIKDRKQPVREEEECENIGFHQSGAEEHIGNTPGTSFTVVKSISLPNMHSNDEKFTPIVPSPRSADDLIVLETRKEVMVDGKAEHVTHNEEREISSKNSIEVMGGDPNGEIYDTYNYVGSAKDWVVPASENCNRESLFFQLNELPSKDFRLKRIEDWVTNIQKYDPPEEETNDSTLDNDHENIRKDKIFTGSLLGKLDCKVNPGMETVQKYISSLSATATSLQLVNHGLVVIPFLGTFMSLKSLNLSGNAIVRITSGSVPRGLHVLNLSRNNISTVEGLRELTRLRVLDLSYNRILRIGHGLAYCSSLKELYLAGNKISEVEGLHRLLKLNVLDLRFNKISTAKSLGQLAANYNSLQSIYLEGNPGQKNVGHEQLKKHLLSLVPHLTYYNGQSIKIGTSKDASDRSCRLGIGSHVPDRGVKADLKVVRKGTAGASSSSSHNKVSSSAIHGRKASKGRHGHLVGPSVSRRSTRQPHVTDPKNNKLYGEEPSIRRSRSEGTLGPF